LVTVEDGRSGQGGLVVVVVVWGAARKVEKEVNTVMMN